MYVHQQSQAARYQSIAIRAIAPLATMMVHDDIVYSQQDVPSVWVDIARAAIELSRRAELSGRRTLATDLHEDR